MADDTDPETMAMQLAQCRDSRRQLEAALMEANSSKGGIVNVCAVQEKTIQEQKQEILELSSELTAMKRNAAALGICADSRTVQAERLLVQKRMEDQERTIRDLQSSAQQFQTAVSAKDGEIADLRKQITQLHEEITQLETIHTSKLQSARTEAQGAETQCDQYRQETVSLHAELAKANERAVALNKTVAALQSELKSEAMANQQQKEAIAVLQKQVGELQQECQTRLNAIAKTNQTHIQEAYRSYQAENVRLASGYKKQVDEYAKSAEAWKQKSEQLEQQQNVQSQQRKVDDEKQRSEMSQLQSEIETLKAEMQKKNQELERTMRDRTSELERSEFQSRIRTLETDLAELQRKNRELETEDKAREAQLQSQARENEQYKTEIEKHETREQELQKQLETEQGSVRLLQEQQRRLELEEGRGKQEFAALQQQTQEARDALAKCEADVAEWKRECDAKVKQCDERMMQLQQEYEQAKEQLVVMRQKESELEQDCLATKRINHQEKESNLALISKLNAANVKITQLENQLAREQRQRDTLTADHNRTKNDLQLQRGTNDELKTKLTHLEGEIQQRRATDDPSTDLKLSQQQVDQARKQAADARNTTAKLNLELQQAQEENARLRHELRVQQQEFATVTQQQQQQVGAHSTTQAELTQKTQEVDRLQSLSQKNTKQILDLETTTKEQKAALAELQRTILQLQTQIQQERSGHKEQVALHETEMETAAGTIEGHKRQLSQSSLLNQKLQQQNLALHRDYDGLKAKERMHLTKITELEKEISEIKGSVDTLEKLVPGSTGQHVNLGTALEQLQTEHDRLRQQCREMEVEKTICAQMAQRMIKLLEKKSTITPEDFRLALRLVQLETVRQLSSELKPAKP